MNWVAINLPLFMSMNTLKKCLVIDSSCSHDNAHLQLGFQQI
jgi:hypothetical protein